VFGGCVRSVAFSAGSARIEPDFEPKFAEQVVFPHGPLAISKTELPDRRPTCAGERGFTADPSITAGQGLALGSR